MANAAAGQWTLFDVRAAWQWNDWHVPGAVNVALDELVDTATAAPAGAKIVLLSKDGDQAFAAAGALLAEHPGLDVYVLRGGVAAYYRDVVLRAASSLPGSAPAMPSPTPATTNNPVIKKRSVGC